MSDSYSKYMEEVLDYRRLCKLLNVEQKDPDINYDHFQELKKHPAVYWARGTYHIDYEKYPEYKL